MEPSASMAHETATTVITISVARRRPAACVRKRMTTLLDRETTRQEAEMKKEVALIAATRVNFDLMPGA